MLQSTTEIYQITQQNWLRSRKTIGKRVKILEKFEDNQLQFEGEFKIINSGRKISTRQRK